MARFRVRLRFNPGRVGAPMDKLGEYATQAEKFLRLLLADLGVEVHKGQWLARSFSNDSVAFDSEFAEEVSDPIAMTGRDALRTLTGKSPLDVCASGVVSYGTVAEFGRIARIMDADEIFYLGVYNSVEQEQEQDLPDWRGVPYRHVANIRRLLDVPLISQGSVQGLVYAWHAGASPAFFNVRELSSGQLVKCLYSGNMHAKIHEAHKRPNSVVHVYGRIEWDRATNEIVQMHASDLDIADPLSPSDFDRFFGSMPTFTGELSTSDYIDWIRDDAE